MPFGLSRLFSRKPTPSIFTTATVNTHWNDQTKTYQHRTDVPMPATFEELETNPDLIALTIFHSMPYSSDIQRSAAWMGEDSPERAKILVEYLRLFNWDGESIVNAFRALCSRIQLKGESQHLDRIVNAFATRWIESNPFHRFISHSVVYTISYSILLLNTDLYSNAEGVKSKMTQKQYIKYVQESLNKMFATERPQFSKVSDYGAYLESENPNMRSLISDTREYARSEWFTAIAGVLKLFYKSIAREPLILPDGLPSLRSQQQQNSNEPPVSGVSSGSGSRSLMSSKRLSRKSSAVSVNSEFGGSSALGSDLTAQAEQDESLDGFGDQEGLDRLRLLGPPWAKEGPLKFQHFANVSNGMKKHHKQEFVDLFAVADRGQLRLYRLRSQPTGRRGQGSNVGDGNWLSRAQLVYNFILTHSLAQSADQSENQGEWSLMLSDGRLLRFKTGTAEIADEWVYTCNYWAARLSKPPQVEMVSSTEYGWDRPMELVRDREIMPPIAGGSSHDSIMIGDERVTVFPWKKQADSELHSGLPAKEQLECLREYIATVDAELALHSTILGDMLRVFNPRIPVSARAHSNWEARSQYLLKQTVQYSTYSTILERSLADDANQSTLNGDTTSSGTAKTLSDVRSDKGSLRSIERSERGSTRNSQRAPSSPTSQTFNDKPLPASPMDVGRPEVYGSPSSPSRSTRIVEDPIARTARVHGRSGSEISVNASPRSARIETAV